MLELKEALKEIRAFAQEALKQFGKLEEQKEYMWNKVEIRPDLLKALARRAFDDLAVGELYIFRNAVKKSIIDGRTYPNESKRGVETIIAARGILDSYYCGDKPIGDCTRAELLHQAQIHMNKGDAEYRRVAIYEAVAKKLKEGETVRQRFKDAQVEKIIQTAGKRQAG